MNDDSLEQARLFFGANVEAPWPDDYPTARMIPEETRHVTFAFLGLQSLSKLQQLLPSAPLPSFKIGPVGIGKELVLLPPGECRVAALAVEWIDPSSEFNDYHKKFKLWLKSNGYAQDERTFFPHITLARSPFDKEAWKEHFTPLPFYVKAIHLYQSMGNLSYKSLWQYPLLSPFDELEHTADIAFLVRGSSLQQLYWHAQLALSFKFPHLIEFFNREPQDSLDEIIISLNQIIGQADTRYGCPFKAVSFHGKIKADEQHTLEWEMIVDV